jgi:hypothetical protein
MTDAKVAFRALLIGSSAVIALVPPERIMQAWPGEKQIFPCIVFHETNNSVSTEDYTDNTPKSETSEIKVDIFCKPGVSSTPIAQAVDLAAYGGKWNRGFSTDLVEPDTGLVHRVALYSKRLRY